MNRTSLNDINETTRAVTQRTRDDYELIIVSYKSRQQVAGLLDGLPNDMPFVIVDNARGSDAVADFVRGRPNGRYIDSGGHKGFAKACNMGVRSSTREFVVIATPDTRLGTVIMEALVSELERDPSLGLICPGTLDDQGRIGYGTGGWEPTVFRALIHSLALHKLFPRAGLFAQPLELGENIELDWLSGAGATVRRSVFLKHNGFDERYYLYGEDVAFSRRLREAGLRRKLHTDLVIGHEIGSSGGVKSTYMLQHRGASTFSYLRHEETEFKAQAIRFVLTAGYLVRYLACCVTGRESLARQHLAYLRGLFFGRPVDAELPRQTKSPVASPTSS